MTMVDERDAELLAQARADAFAADLRWFADMVQANPDLYDLAWNMRDHVNLPIPSDADAVELLAHVARLGLAAGCKVRKEFDDWAAVTLTLPAGVVELYFYAARSRVCERVVTATREVTKEVPDPEALKAVPTVTVTETIEDVEWVCRPLLADERSST